jgi:predicted NBD/HSP70 family sugar kinase
LPVRAQRLLRNPRLGSRDRGTGRGGLGDGRASSLQACRPVTAVEVFDHAAAGDALALELVETAGGWIARAVHELVMAYDVRRVALGGGVASAGATFLAPIVRGLDRLRNSSALAAEALPPDIVELLGAEAETGTWGALILARSAATVAADQPAHAAILGREVASG